MNKNDSIQLLTKWLFDIRSSLDHNTDLIQRQVHSANQSLGNQLNSATHIMRLLNNDLGQIKEIGRQLNDFQHLFRTPNYRGQIGEHILADLINQVLPGCCKTLQHRFQNGHIVDALIRTEKGNIAIDSKFPTESFKKKSQAKTEQQRKAYNRDFLKDVKRHIQSVSQKYIVPAEGTLDFAVIYIPSELIYQEIISNDTLLDIAQKDNILMVSPNSFYYFLKVILLGLESSQIERRTKHLLDILNALRQDSAGIGRELKVLMNHLTRTQNSVNRLSSDFERIVTKLNNIDLMKDETSI